MSKEDNYINVEGVITELVNKTTCLVKLVDNDMVIRASVSGKMRQHNIHILPGDKVTVALSTYDLTHGRIIYRQK